MPYILDWLGDFWNRIGQYFMRRIWFFGETRVSAGKVRENHPMPFQPAKVWFCVKSPRDLPPGQAGRANMGRAKAMPDGTIDVVADVKSDTKVVWFGHI